MADPKQRDNQHNELIGPNRGQAHGGQRGDLSGDRHHNQASAVRGSGDQNPGDIYRSEQDREQEVRERR